MPRRPRQPGHRERTPYASLYGHPYGPTVIKSQIPLKSGLTPLDEGPFKTFDELLNYRILNTHQRLQLSAFSTKELKTLEALTIEDAGNYEGRSLDLNGLGIHPLLKIHKWKHTYPKHESAKIPLGNGRAGYWEVDNPIVWEAIKPSLQLATLFLENVHNWPWFDALLAGKMEPIPRTDLSPNSSNHLRFFCRSPDQVWNNRNATQGKLLQVSNDIFFRLGGAYINNPPSLLRAKDEPDDPQESCWGITDRIPPAGMNEGKATCEISFEIIEPLLNPAINTAEKTLVQFGIALTILHEFMHALWKQIWWERNAIRESIEPYFEDEAVAELGWSMENAFFGGLSKPFSANAYITVGFLRGGMVQYDFNSFRTDTAGQPVVIKDSPSYNMATWFPVPCRYYIDLHDTTIWPYFRKYGPKATHMGPKTRGFRKNKGGDSKNRFVWEDYIPEPPESDTNADVINLGLSPEEEAKKLFENDTRRRTRRIIEAVRHHRRKQRTIKEQQSTIGLSVSDDEFTKRRTELINATDEDTDNEDHPSQKALCPRFNEIRTYLLSKRRELALDTMHFKMAEHVFYAYIEAEGGLAITPAELRKFLIRCSQKKTLFTWEKWGQWPLATPIGFIERCDSGWVNAPPVPRPKPNKVAVSPSRVQQFVSKIEECFYNQYFSYDADGKSAGIRIYDFDILQLMSLVNSPKIGGVVPGPDFQLEEFEECLWECENAGDQFVFGPKGIIRKLRGQTPSPSPSPAPSGTSSTSSTTSSSYLSGSPAPPSPVPDRNLGKKIGIKARRLRKRRP